MFSTPINNPTSPTSGAPATATMQSPRVTITRRKRNRSVIPTFGVLTVEMEWIERHGGLLTSSTALLSFPTSPRTSMSPAMPFADSLMIKMMIYQVLSSSSLRDQEDQSKSKAKSMVNKAVPKVTAVPPFHFVTLTTSTISLSKRPVCWMVLVVPVPMLLQLLNGTHSRVLTSMESCILSRTLPEAVFQKFLLQSRLEFKATRLQNTHL